MSAAEVPTFSNDRTADLLETIAEDLRSGETSRKEARHTLFAFLTFEDPVEVRDGPLRSEGELSFGLSRGGEDGVGYWLPREAIPDHDGDQ